MKELFGLTTLFSWKRGKPRLLRVLSHVGHLGSLSYQPPEIRKVSAQMIDPNLHYVLDFLKPILDTAVSQYEKTWSTENRVHCTSRVEDLAERGLLQNEYFSVAINPELMKKTTGKEKVFIYEIIRSLAIADQRFGYILFDLQELYRKRGFRSERYFYLQSLTDNMFIYEIDCKVDINNSERRYYFRQINGHFGRDQLTFSELLSKYLIILPKEIKKRTPRKRVRHKGFRDHGSLGSEFSRSLKQQSRDWTLREEEQRRKKKIEDFRNFLWGLGGWI